MKFAILNVEHGFCGYAVGRDSGVLLFDCGHGATVRASTHLPSVGVTSIRRLFITNYDEDHISDLPELRRSLPIQILTRNPSLTTSQIRRLKAPPITAAMAELLDMVDSYTSDVDSQSLDPLGLRVETFHNDYPVFADTNNLSLLTFLDVGRLCFVLGGDLEKAGWAKLLENPRVQHLLSRVSVFVASHHGRESGYCPDIFHYCRPSLIVISDGPIKHETQETGRLYAQHARGEYFDNHGRREFRRVVTTRRDGTLFWNV